MRMAKVALKSLKVPGRILAPDQLRKLMPNAVQNISKRRKVWCQLYNLKQMTPFLSTSLTFYPNILQTASREAYTFLWLRKDMSRSVIQTRTL